MRRRLYTDAVSLRKTRIARTFAVALLLWTAVDLGNPTLCALDTPVDARAAGAAMHAADLARPVGVPPIHVDDCFCCSLHVRPSAKAIPTTAGVGAPRHVRANAEGLPSAEHAAIYHPPQLLS